MTYIHYYESPIGTLLLSSDEIALTGLWFVGEKHCADAVPREHTEGKTDVIDDTVRWLDIYFSGKRPDFTPLLRPAGSCFRQSVLRLLMQIPYGCTTTYGELSVRLAHERKSGRMSAQAVGGAVGHNSISIIIPCHRVVGANGSLTGYAGGIDRKIKLLELEGADLSGFFAPKECERL